MDLAPSIHSTADELSKALLANSKVPTYVCVHYRQGDKLMVSPREYNYTYVCAQGGCRWRADAARAQRANGGGHF